MTKRICKVVFTILALVVVLYTFLPIPIGNQRGVYNTITGLYWCSDTYSCNHELGHKMDAQLGWISQTPEFENALNELVLKDFAKGKLTPFSYLIVRKMITYENGFHQLITNEQSEIYADIYALSDASREKMPDSLEPFYLWDDTND